MRRLSATLRDPRCTHVVFEDGAQVDSESKQLLQAAGFVVAPLARQEQSAHALHNDVASKPRAR